MRAFTHSKVIPIRSGALCSRPTGHEWPRAHSTRQCECGTLPARKSKLCYDSGASYQTIKSGGDSTKIVVNGASLSIPSQKSFPRTKAGSLQSHSNVSVSSLGIKDDWVTLSSERILWLPPEYRNGKWVNYGDKIVIGSANGRVTFVRCNATGSSSS
jgi:hypothetical protein